MAYAWESMLAHVARRISDAVEQPVEATDLVLPPQSDLGDIAFGCFKFAKTLSRSPADIAKEIAAKLSKADHTIESASAAGPYVNVTLQSREVVSRVAAEVLKFGPSYGGQPERVGAEVMLEYAQPNTHKEIHVGHLRNLTMGTTIVRLLRHAGWRVVPASYHGDVGAHVAKCLWWFVRSTVSVASPSNPFTPASDMTEFLQGLTEEWVRDALRLLPKEKRTGQYLGEMYAESSRQLETHPEWKEEVSVAQRAIEANHSAWTVLWQETRRWSVDEMAVLFQDLGVSIQRQYFESEVVDEGQRIVDELIAKGVARESLGAIIVDLEEYGLGVFLIRKSDGTSLYATKDLALAQLKVREYPDLARSLLLVDNRQSLYFKQLFKTLQLAGLHVPQEFIGYEFVTLKTGAMSSREGNVVTWQSFRDEVIAYARKETEERHPDWPEGRVEHTAWCLAMAGAKFGMLRQDGDKIYTFDLERAMAFDGDTGPYVQYAATRLGSILKKANWDMAQAASATWSDGTAAEKKLAICMAQFPGICQRAAQELRPSILAQWCVTLAQRVSEFYRDVQVLDAAPSERSGRLALSAAARSVLSQSMDMLGIPMPDEM